MSAKRCLVFFQPQAWIFDNAVDSDHGFEIDVTKRVLAMGQGEALEIEDSSDESDSLVHGLHEHTGPFYVSCEDQIREFFGVDEDAEVSAVEEEIA